MITEKQQFDLKVLRELNLVKYKYLKFFNFEEKDIFEIIDEEIEFQNNIAKEKKEWEKSLLSKKEAENIFLTDKTITKDKIFEMKRKHLQSLYENICYKLYEAEARGEFVDEFMKVKNKIKFEYEVYTFQPDYPKDQITDEEIERADAREISDFIDTGRRGFICCPFHKEKNPSMHITKNKFYCFGCNEKGRTINFVMKYYNLNFKEAVKKINL